MPPTADLTTRPISDELLERVIRIARDASAGATSPVEANLLLALTPELLAELLHYRRTIGDLLAETVEEALAADAPNVVALRPRPRLVADGPELGGAA